MRAYRCYLLDCNNEIAAMEVFRYAYDIDARQQADILLVRRLEFHGVEVWDLDRRVYVNVAGTDAARSARDAAE
jgi:hypothetical protein